MLKRSQREKKKSIFGVRSLKLSFTSEKFNIAGKESEVSLNW